ncbi:monovalent cation/H+ antiporter complex subunit F [Peloplasma aerotolerans]|jgi:multicomponent Na+:H+ antiporter subunit F|uniref:Monovalent cation/H+ antiporter complex subunit F n=1 Tax=Peloplasma aerotolerans TaxID=3044389 RepID=A0AAW6UCP8_9MOLU|nr:monovalent cation/H+ antiporter complex subunit F [Mariniplasma sp. M4Ah]MDI6453271.1 monovalent cation/H+ antiporter complex subunit F [Mariniplasma sp. M4Ah]MDR4968825.1 monovalent cation/H+ antiporter complex subunit F [Acholeplasmataceae bacterium]
MIDILVITCAVVLVLMSFVALYRAFKGPTAADRIVAINIIATKVTTIIVLIALVTKQSSYVNVALIYAMIGFLATIGVAKYLLKGRLD